MSLSESTEYIYLVAISDDNVIPGKEISIPATKELTELEGTISVLFVRLTKGPKGVVASGVVNCIQGNEVLVTINDVRKNCTSGMLPLLLICRAPNIIDLKYSTLSSGYLLPVDCNELIKSLWNSGSNRHSLAQLLEWWKNKLEEQPSTWLMNYRSRIQEVKYIRESSTPASEDALEWLWAKADNDVVSLKQATISKEEFIRNKDFLRHLAQKIILSPDTDTWSEARSLWQEKKDNNDFKKFHGALINRIFAVADPEKYTTILSEDAWKNLLTLFANEFEITPLPYNDFITFNESVSETLRIAGIAPTEGALSNVAMWELCEEIAPYQNKFAIPAWLDSDNEDHDMSQDDAPDLLNQILYGPPGTGKTFRTMELAVKIIAPALFSKNLSREEIRKTYAAAIESGDIVFTTFHQSLAYESFVEGISAGTSKDGNLVYKTEAGIFKTLCKRALSNTNATDEDNNATRAVNRNVVLIIDEINRGNVSRIFGELITLLEKDKRKGQAEELSVVLPYSKESFSVPSNVYVIGTMNTSDRSLASIDLALRRRFKFIHVLPEPSLLGDTKIAGIHLAHLLARMNERIEVLLDADHLIGHAYFMPLLNGGTLKDLADIFRTQIIPLLGEYFFDDAQKICWVLNDHRKEAQHQIVKQLPDRTAELFGENINLPSLSRKWRLNETALESALSFEYIIGVEK